jgi:hypothetical protein
MVRKDDIRLVDTVARKVGLSKEQRRLLHRAIAGQYLKYGEILEEAKMIKRAYPRK